jgi:hypothetical protein
MSDIPILGKKPEAQQLVEVCRSFSRRLNLENHGGPRYEHVEFFASRKIQCAAEQCAAEDSSWVSQQIFEECVEEVRKAMADYVAEMQRRKMQAQKKAEQQRRTA